MAEAYTAIGASLGKGKKRHLMKNEKNHRHRIKKITSKALENITAPSPAEQELITYGVAIAKDLTFITNPLLKCKINVDIAH